MSEQDLKGLWELEKKFYRKLSELMGLTRELADAVEWQDQVSLTLLLSMRQKVILELEEVRNYIDLLRYDFDAITALRFDALLSGSAAENVAEQPVVETISANRHLLSQVHKLDQHLNHKLCGQNSFYL